MRRAIPARLLPALTLPIQRMPNAKHTRTLCRNIVSSLGASGALRRRGRPEEDLGVPTARTAHAMRF